jgi:hypothetical protein
VLDEINRFYRQLVILDSDCRNDWEIRLIGNLEQLLRQAESGSDVDWVMLEYMQNRRSRASCISEKYGHMISFLESHLNDSAKPA